jgi:hypothetical protein
MITRIECLILGCYYQNQIIIISTWPVVTRWSYNLPAWWLRLSIDRRDFRHIMKTWVMTTLGVCLCVSRVLGRSLIFHSYRTTLHDTIIDTNVDVLSEFTVMDTYNQSTIYRLLRKLVRLWLEVMPSSISQRWGVPVFLACLAYECFRPVGCENVILFAPFPCLFFLLVFVVGKCSLLYEFTKNTVKAPALQSADNVVLSQHFVANIKKTSNACLFCGVYVILLKRRTVTLLYNWLHTVSLCMCLFWSFSNAQFLKKRSHFTKQKLKLCS